jgi:hypothetical protein
MADPVSVDWRAVVVKDRSLLRFHSLSVRLISLIASVAL